MTAAKTSGSLSVANRTSYQPGPMPVIVGNAVLLTALAAAACDPAEPSTTTAFVGATVVVGQDLEPIEGANIVVDDGRIVCVDTPERCPAEGAGQTIDARGKWIIPGLFDNHTHVAEYSYMPWAPLFLAHGITSLRDVGARTDSSLALRGRWQEEPLGPNLFIAGHPIDGDPPNWPDAFPDVPLIVRTPEEARDAVRRAKAEGVDFIKLYNALTPEALVAATEEAHALGLKVTADLWGWNAPTSVALEAGIDGLEHYVGEQLDFDLGTDDRPRLLWGVEDEKLGALLDELVEGQVVLTATWETLQYEGGSFPDHKPTYRALPATLQEISRGWWDDWQKSPDNSEAQIAFWRTGFMEQGCRTVLELQRRGGKVAVGTDAFWYVAYPGDIHDEMSRLQDCGLTPREALATATTTPAAWLEVDSLGVIQAGAVADFVVLLADPLDNIDNTRRIDLVVRRGVTLGPDSLLVEAKRYEPPPADQ
ncbi:MAG: amidohydrolase family protein [Gemmatimonadota bacterium]